MNFNWRHWAGFGAGLLLGAGAAAWYVLGSRPAGPPPAAPTEAAASQPQRPARQASAPVAAVAPAGLAKTAVACPPQPLLAAAKGSDDGRVKLPTDLEGRTAADVRRLMLAGKEAAASGRPRDAEIDFLLACRVAVQRLGADSVEATDASYQLAWHYANRVWTGGAGSQRAALLARAEQLYADSLAAYAAHHGEDHERSRFAAQGLARVREATGATAAASAARVLKTAREAGAAREAREAIEARNQANQAQAIRAAQADAARRAAPAAPPPAAAIPVKPSFDCARARSRPEKIICADAELARLDRELGRLHSRARSAAADPAAFKRANDREWLRRESTCRDRACLLDWYAQRREQLLDALGP